MRPRFDTRPEAGGYESQQPRTNRSVPAAARQILVVLRVFAQIARRSPSQSAASMRPDMELRAATEQALTPGYHV